jgi:uncharacterized protein (DUF1800 family)
MAETPLEPLDKLDPVAAWQPWEPSDKTAWNLKWAGHLFRRAGFGASVPELREAVKAGLPATLDRLMKGDKGADTRLKFLEATGVAASHRSGYELRAWWLYGMLHSLYPLREKLTLFWHDHFATSINKVTRAFAMYRQNLLLRQHALGRFPDFLQAMSKDPAMLLWLDSASNVKGKPNENYAREVMELFSLGVGNYTEKDIREAARAFTGWQTEDDEYVFVAREHDDGDKTVLGKSGTFNGEDVVRICLEQAACAKFLVRKLYRFLVSERETPPDTFLQPLADDFRKSGYDIAALVRRMVGSRHFFSEYAYRQRIKCPVEFALGIVSSLTDRQIPPRALVSRLDAMGQTLFAPPNVKGWPGGASWLNTATVLARHNFAQMVAMGGLRDSAPRPTPLNPIEAERERAEEAQRLAEEARQLAEEEKLRAEGKPVPPRPEPAVPPPAANMDVAAQVQREKLTKPAEIVNFLLDMLLQGDASATARAKLTAFLEDGKPGGANLTRRIRETAHVIMTMPEYQLA